MKSSYLRARAGALVACGVALAVLGSSLEASAVAAAPTSPLCEGGSPLTLNGEGACSPKLPASPSPGSPSCGCEAVFTIEKRQQIEGSASGFTTSPLSGAIGETVDYEIIVENTGFFPETFAEFSDPQCDPGTVKGGPGTSPVAAGQSTTYTCTRALSAAGIYTNEAAVTGISVWGMSSTQRSNQVVVEVPPQLPPPLVQSPKFRVEKLQQVAGSIGTFTMAKLTAAVGQTLNYQIVVKNIGVAPLALSVSDEQCDPGTLAGGLVSTPLPAAQSVTYSCTRHLASAGTYTNVANVTGTNLAGTSLTVSSNRVEATVPESQQPAVPTPPTPAKPAGGVEHSQCERSPSSSSLRGASGRKRTPFTVSFPSKGIARIAFYVDGRKVKLLTQAAARNGSFSIKLDPRTLAYGTHRVTVKTRMTDRECPAVARSSAFTDPKPKPPPPPG